MTFVQDLSDAFVKSEIAFSM